MDRNFTVQAITEKLELLDDRKLHILYIFLIHLI